MLLRWHCIAGVIERHVLLQFRDLYRIIDNFYWPMFDVILWGFMSLWVTERDVNRSPEIMLAILGGVFLWNMLYRSSLEISVNLTEELWSRNLINLFSTPLTISEWLCSLLMMGVIRVLMTVTVLSAAIFFIFNINVFSIGLPILWCILLQMISGWSIGIVCAALIIYWGHTVQSLPWPMGWFFAPFCGAFAPIEVMPAWIQKVSAFIPMTYTFKAMRGAIAGEPIEFFLLKGLVLNLFYLMCALFLFFYLFKLSKVYGLERLED